MTRRGLCWKADVTVTVTVIVGQNKKGREKLWAKKAKLETTP
jgi:hypothetical protein